MASEWATAPTPAEAADIVFTFSHEGSPAAAAEEVMCEHGASLSDHSVDDISFARYIVLQEASAIRSA
jgi:hypothetical protein